MVEMLGNLPLIVTILGYFIYLIVAVIVTAVLVNALFKILKPMLDKIKKRKPKREEDEDEAHHVPWRAP